MHPRRVFRLTPPFLLTCACRLQYAHDPPLHAASASSDNSPTLVSTLVLQPAPSLAVMCWTSVERNTCRCLQHLVLAWNVTLFAQTEPLLLPTCCSTVCNSDTWTLVSFGPCVLLTACCCNFLMTLLLHRPCWARHQDRYQQRWTVRLQLLLQAPYIVFQRVHRSQVRFVLLNGSACFTYPLLVVRSSSNDRSSNSHVDCSHAICCCVLYPHLTPACCKASLQPFR